MNEIHYYDRKAKATIYEVIDQRFHRKTQTLQGVRGTSLPYTWGSFLRPGMEGPRGGKAYKKCWRTVWFADGRFCKVASVKDDDGWHREFVPLTETVWNRWDEDEGTHRIVNGELAMLDDNGNAY